MDVITVIVTPIVEVLMVPVKKHLGYLISCNDYVAKMDAKMKELDNTRNAEKTHLDTNNRSRLEIPPGVEGWLKEVETVNAKVESIPRDVSCCSLKIRHTVGKTAFKITEEIASVTENHKNITWTNTPLPPGQVDSTVASTSTVPSTEHNDFRSRAVTFTKALEALGPKHKYHMVALCGMGGVGKTTMMEMLEKVVHERKMFKFIIKVDPLGEKTDVVAVQNDIAYYLGVQFNNKIEKGARADMLRKKFQAESEGGKNRFLIILDDVWESVDMRDIGLSRFPDQGVDFKVLLTSRDKDVCANMGAEANSIFDVGVLIETEARSLFRQFVENSDPELQKIGEDIVRKCRGLPIAIKTMACTLKNKSKDAWDDALRCLEKHVDIEKVTSEVFETSYKNLRHDDPNILSSEETSADESYLHLS